MRISNKQINKQKSHPRNSPELPFSQINSVVWGVLCTHILDDPIASERGVRLQHQMGFLRTTPKDGVFIGLERWSSTCLVSMRIGILSPEPTQHNLKVMCCNLNPGEPWGLPTNQPYLFGNLESSKRPCFKITRWMHPQ